MMQGMMPIVHVSSPINEDTWEISCSGNTKREIYIGPFIFACFGGRACNGSAGDSAVIPGEF
jgi:hypothetical protein